MTEVLVVGDIHLTGKNPPNRIDDVTELQFKKMEEIRDAANSLAVPVLCTGDIYHTPIVSNPIVARFGQIIQSINMGFYFVLGNHDLQYHDMDRIEKTSIGVTWYNNFQFRHIATFDNSSWAFIDYGVEINCPPSAKYMLSHKAIVNDKLVSSESWISEDTNFCDPVSKYDKMGFKLIICGHWHRPYIYKHRNTLVINPGPVVRRSITERDIPSMVLVDLISCEYERIPFKCARPTEEVLRESGIRDELKPISDRISGFINKIRAQKSIKHGISFMSALNDLLENPTLDRGVKAEIIDIMAVLAAKKGEKLNADAQ